MSNYASNVQEVNEMLRGAKSSAEESVGDEEAIEEQVSLANWKETADEYAHKYSALAEGGGAEIGSAILGEGTYKGVMRVRDLYKKYKAQKKAYEDQKLMKNKKSEDDEDPQGFGEEEEEEENAQGFEEGDLDEESPRIPASRQPELSTIQEEDESEPVSEATETPATEAPEEEAPEVDEARTLGEGDTPSDALFNQSRLQGRNPYQDHPWMRDVEANRGDELQPTDGGATEQEVMSQAPKSVSFSAESEDNLGNKLLTKTEDAPQNLRELKTKFKSKSESQESFDDAFGEGDYNPAVTKAPPVPKKPLDQMTEDELEDHEDDKALWDSYQEGQRLVGEKAQLKAQKAQQRRATAGDDQEASDIPVEGRNQPDFEPPAVSEAEAVAEPSVVPEPTGFQPSKSKLQQNEARDQPDVGSEADQPDLPPQIEETPVSEAPEPPSVARPQEVELEDFSSKVSGDIAEPLPPTGNPVFSQTQQSEIRPEDPEIDDLGGDLLNDTSSRSSIVSTRPKPTLDNQPASDLTPTYAEPSAGSGLSPELEARLPPRGQAQELDDLTQNLGGSEPELSGSTQTASGIDRDAQLTSNLNVAEDDKINVINQPVPVNDNQSIQMRDISGEDFINRPDAPQIPDAPPVKAQPIENLQVSNTNIEGDKTLSRYAGEPDSEFTTLADKVRNFNPSEVGDNVFSSLAERGANIRGGIQNVGNKLFGQGLDNVTEVAKSTGTQLAEKVATTAGEDVGETIAKASVTDAVLGGIPVVGELALGITGLVSIGEGIYHLFHHHSSAPKPPQPPKLTPDITPSSNLTNKYSQALPSIDTAQDVSASVMSF